jgi:glyoxylase-like metal-dependent hydrolase (beta-lactamase superfamily II)
MKIKNSPKFIKTGFTTSYLLEAKNGYLLIDTGYPEDYAKFLDKIKNKYNLQISDITTLLLTHHHDDHAGFAAELISNTNCKLIVHENALERLKMGKSEEESFAVNKRVKFIFGLFDNFHEFVFPP